MTLDHTLVKLGKQPAKVDMRLPLMRAYMDHLPAAPLVCDWTGGRTQFGMLGNQDLGDCTSAAMAHLIGTASGAAGRGYWQASDTDAISEYSKSAGYVPGKPETDQGAVEADVLAHWHAHGYCGWTIDGYGRINLGDIETFRKSVWLLSSCYVGISLPTSAQNQPVWMVPKGGPVGDGEPNSWGGHAVECPKYDANKGLYYFSTWGGLQAADEDFIHAYVDEKWGVAVTAFLDKTTGKTPGGFDRAGLKQRMAELA